MDASQCPKQTKFSGWKKQFCISPDPTIVSPDWLRERHGALTLSRHPTTPRCLVAVNGTPAGIIIGWFEYAGRFYDVDSKIELSQFDQLYADLTGRFVLVQLNSDGFATVGPDPTASYPLVFHQGSKTVASSPGIFSAFADLSEDSEAAEGVIRYDDSKWFPFGLVPYEGVCRLLPGQLVNLRHGTLNRQLSWEKLEVSGDERDISTELLNRVAGFLRTVDATSPMQLHLTAGVDSRMVLAAALYADIEPQLMTIGGMGKSSNLDVSVAKRITSRIGARHEQIAFVPPTAEELHTWMDRTGGCIQDSVSTLCTTIEQSDRGATTITGTGGEIGRAFYWSDEDIHSFNLRPEELLAKLGFSDTPLLRSRASSWLASYPSGSRRTFLLDEAYVNIRMPCWAAPSVLGHNIDKPTISPFNNARTISQMINLPERYRLSGCFARDFIAMAGMGLERLPFNRPIGLSKFRFASLEAKALIPASLKVRMKHFVRRQRQRK